MSKTAILYALPSREHRKLLTPYRPVSDVDLVSGRSALDLARYVTVGIASGVYAGPAAGAVRKALAR
jgi:hypothetical protein